MICLILVAVRIPASSYPQEWNAFEAGAVALYGCGELRAGKIDRQTRGDGRTAPADRAYKPNHNYHEEWVYTAADVDHAQVIFAREMDPVSDREIREYFKDRQAWLEEPDEPYVRVSPIDTKQAAVH